MVSDPTMQLEMGDSRQLLRVTISEGETEILNAASGIEKLRATSEIKIGQIERNVRTSQLSCESQSPLKATGAGLAEAMSPRESWNPRIEKSVSDSQIERVRPGDIEGNASDSQIEIGEIEKGRRAHRLGSESLNITNEFRKEEIESEATTSQLSCESITDARQFEKDTRTSQLSRRDSEGGRFEDPSQLFSESVVIKSFSESESFSKSQQGGIRPIHCERAYRLCQTDFPKEAMGASLGKTTPLRTFSTSKTADATKIWEEAERKLGASRANF
jgi:hypothetical protein